jgi:hypothetical protein
MNQETYENLIRVIEKRIRRASITGDQAARKSAIADKINLETHMRLQNFPDHQHP